MNLKLQILMIALSVIVGFTLFRSIRKASVRGGFAILWLVICIAALTLPIMDSTYKYLSIMLGFNYATDMLTLFAIIFLTIYSFYLTSKLTRVLDSTEVLLANFAILENSVAEIKEQSTKSDSTMKLQPSHSDTSHS